MTNNNQEIGKGGNTIKIDAVNLVQNLVSKALSIEDYQKIMDTYMNVDISSNEEFQKLFNRFYVVRRNKEWRRIYYDFFQKNKYNKNITFGEILRHLYDNPHIENSEKGWIEASFSSKMLATIRPEMPIWDRYIIEHFKIKLVKTKPEDRIEECVAAYKTIVDEYKKYLKTPEGIECIAKFDEIMPNYKTKLSNIKKVDYMIWGVREG